MAHIAAVLTGDLIGSTEAPAETVAATMENLAESARLAGQLAKTDLRFTRFRGDGWQVVLDPPAALFEVIVLILARRRMVPGLLETRCAIGVGTIDSRGTADLNDAHGPAFTQSGQMLDRMGHTGRTEFAFADMAQSFPQRGRVVLVPHTAIALLAFLNFIAQGWTQGQAEAVAETVLMTTSTPVSDLAGKLHITRQAAGQRLQGAGWSPILRASTAFHEITLGWEDPDIR